MASRVFKGLGLVIGSIAVGFILTFLIAETLGSQMNYLPFGQSLPFVLWGVFIIVFIYLGRNLVIGKVNFSRKGGWEPPEQIRDSVINQPQFVGRLDKEKGLIETTARMVSIDQVNQSSYWSQSGVNYGVIRFRGELLDQNGSILEYIPVEIKAKRSDWVGEIADGDRVRVEGKIEKDGILHAETAFNYSTNSRVGNPKK